MHSLAFVRHALTIGLVLVLPCHSLTYWVDDSCRGKIPDAITEGIKMAERANTRLRDAADTDMEVIFKRIFKADKSDVNSYREVTRVEGGIGQFTETQSRPSSDVRLYCDNDVAGPNKRWQLVPDIKGDLRPNSARPAKDQDWVDTINHVRRTRDTMGCQDKNTQGETFSLLPRITPPGENPSRSTVTICDMQTQGAMHTIPAAKKDLTALTTLDPFDALTSLVILHEFSHVPAYGIGDEQYMWSGIDALSNSESLDNADSYAYAGLLAVLGDRSYRLSTRDAEARIGILVYHDPPASPKRRDAKSRNDRKMKLRWIDDMGFLGSGGKVLI